MFSCDSIDHVMHVPEKMYMSKKLSDNPGKTGNLEGQLKIKVNSPVAITTNHSKKKIRRRWNNERSKRLCTESSSFER